MKKIPFSPPDITKDEINEVIEALQSGWITTGPKTKLFEKNICEYVGSSHCVCLNSQTACAEMTLHLLGIGPGDEVILPAYTYTATCSVVCHVGATPIIIDSQKNSVEMDYDALERAITKKTKVIMPVDIAGIPCDYKRIYEIVNKKKALFKASDNEIQKAINRIIVVADTAHSFGAIQNGVHTGMIADFSCFSFHAVKNLTTAEGGAVTWLDIPGVNSDELYHQYQLLSLHGQSKDALAKTKLGAWEYDIVGTFYKCNMTDVVAAIGLAQLRRYDSLLARRKSIIDRYNKGLAKYDVSVLNHLDKNNASSCHLYFVRFNGKEVEYRNEFIIKMAELGVGTNVHYKPLPMHTAYKKLGFDIKNYPNAYNFYKNEMTLPLHTCLTDEDVDYVLDCFGKVYQEMNKR
ncbi:MAG TPA: DegT/DnrJ/EryC1/StrS aminotransferase family protein [Bacilli bacterium]|nr:DegT/DnrJ/EryC1/StrS aminotransferase family protein [Bacilli bacterium]HPS19000.1 DegT/DnrJ/EryC1/StrS aminotransferase family protein [Bacilli bacterium]